MSNEEYDDLVNNIVEEKDLEFKVHQLQEYRKQGFTSLEDAKRNYKVKSVSQNSSQNSSPNSGNSPNNPRYSRKNSSSKLSPNSSPPSTPLLTPPSTPPTPSTPSTPTLSPSTPTLSTPTSPTPMPPPMSPVSPSFRSSSRLYEKQQKQRELQKQQKELKQHRAEEQQQKLLMHEQCHPRDDSYQRLDLQQHLSNEEFLDDSVQFRTSSRIQQKKSQQQIKKQEKKRKGEELKISLLEEELDLQEIIIIEESQESLLPGSQFTQSPFLELQSLSDEYSDSPFSPSFREVFPEEVQPISEPFSIRESLTSFEIVSNDISSINESSLPCTISEQNDLYFSELFLQPLLLSEFLFEEPLSKIQEIVQEVPQIKSPRKSQPQFRDTTPKKSRNKQKLRQNQRRPLVRLQQQQLQHSITQKQQQKQRQRQHQQRPSKQNYPSQDRSSYSLPKVIPFICLY